MNPIPVIRERIEDADVVTIETDADGWPTIIVFRHNHPPRGINVRPFGETRLYDCSVGATPPTPGQCQVRSGSIQCTKPAGHAPPCGTPSGTFVPVSTRVDKSSRGVVD